jgi:hypothetical protein
MRYMIICLACVGSLMGHVAIADQAGAQPPGAPNPPPSPIPSSTTIIPGMVGGTQQPGVNPNTGPTNPSQAPSPSAPGIILTIPTK